MASTLLQQHTRLTSFAKTTKRDRRATTPMAWTNEKLRFKCIDNAGFKHLWKLIAFEPTTNNSNRNSKQRDVVIANELQQQTRLCPELEPQPIYKYNERSNTDDCDNLSEYFTKRGALPPDSLLKFLAINALDLSAPATLVLLQQHQKTESSKPRGWVQLSGHPESIVPTSIGIVRKRIASELDSEVHAYRLLSEESQTAQIVPTYYGTRELNGEHFIELQDLLAGFKDPCVMDIKMGSRTFLESEVTNKTLRSDLYKKMIAVDINAPTAEEHAAKAITKLRYMMFREAMSSSQSKGFRIEAIRLRGQPPIKDLKQCRTDDQVIATIEQFLHARKSVQKELIKRLKHMRFVIEQSPFFKCHEIVGSSIFLVYDNNKVGAWLIDFAKSSQLPQELTVNHRCDWIPGNREEGLLKGIDSLIECFEEVYERNNNKRKCF